MDWMPQAIREGIFTILFISGPLVILAAGLGLAIGIIQAATQVQEQTLGSAVKVIGLLLALIVFGFYMFQYLSQYTAVSLQRAFKLVPALGSYVLPRENFLTKPKDDEALTPQSPPTTLNKQGPKTSGSSTADELKSEPEIINTRKPNNPNDILATTKSNNQNQAKLQPAPVQSQTLKPVTQVGVSKPAPAPVRPAPAKPAVVNKPAAVKPAVPAKPAPAKPAPAKPSISPAAPPQQQTNSSLNDRLSRLRGSVGDVNKELQEVGQ